MTNYRVNVRLSINLVAPSIAAVNITSSTTGMIIPPSNILIVYSLASGGVSIAALFLAGYIPGILTGLFLMIVAAIWAKKKNFPVGERTKFSRRLTECTNYL